MQPQPTGAAFSLKRCIRLLLENLLKNFSIFPTRFAIFCFILVDYQWQCPYFLNRIRLYTRLELAIISCDFLLDNPIRSFTIRLCFITIHIMTVFLIIIFIDRCNPSKNGYPGRRLLIIKILLLFHKRERYCKTNKRYYLRKYGSPIWNGKFISHSGIIER